MGGFSGWCGRDSGSCGYDCGGEGVKRASVKSTDVQGFDVLQNTYTQPQPTITMPSVG